MPGDHPIRSPQESPPKKNISPGANKDYSVESAQGAHSDSQAIFKPSNCMSIKEIGAFLREVWGRYSGNYYYEIRLIPNEGKPIQKFFKSWKAAYSWLMRNKDLIKEYNCYYGVLPRIRPEGSKAAIDLSQMLAVPLFTDIDYKDSVPRVEEFLKEIEELEIKPWIVVFSGHGYHLYVLVLNKDGAITIEKYEELLRRYAWYLQERGFPADPKVGEAARILRIPGTLNVKDPDNPIRVRLLSVAQHIYDLDYIEAILPKVSPGARRVVEKPEEVKIEPESKDLTEGQVLKIVELLKPVYKPGNREVLIGLYLSSWFYKRGIKRDCLKRIAQILAEYDRDVNKSADWDQKLRRILYQIDYHFDRRGPVKGEELKGKTGVQEILEQVLGEEKALEVMRQLEEILGPSPHYGDSTFILVDLEKRVGFVNNPRRCIIAQFRISHDRIIYTRIITKAAIESMKIIRSPLGTPSIYEITWKTRVRTFTTRGFINDHINRLKLEALVVSKRLIEDALNSIISKMEESGKAEVIEEIDVEGFYLNSDGVIISKPGREDVTRDWEENIIKLRGALLTLNELIENWFKHVKEKAAFIIKWHLMAPFNFTRKQLKITPVEMLLIEGPGGTGKTTLGRLGAYIWGLPLTRYETSGEGAKNPARLSAKVKQWTYPVQINEPAAIFDSVENREFIKNAWDSLVARGKYKFGEYIEELAAAPLIFVSNTPIVERLSDAERRRVIIIKFSWKDRLKEIYKEKYREMVRKFNELEKKCLPELSIIGDFVYDYLKNRPESLRRDWVELAEEILERLYKVGELEVPDWIKLRCKVEAQDPGEEWREEIKLLINEYLAEVIINYATRHELLMRPDFESRINFVTETRLPSAVLRHGDRVIIMKEFIKFLNKKGVYVTSLKDLGELMGWKYRRACYRKIGVSTWVVEAPLREFIEEQ